MDWGPGLEVFVARQKWGVPYLLLSIVKMVEMKFQRVDFEQNLKNICPATVFDIVMLHV